RSARALCLGRAARWCGPCKETPPTLASQRHRSCAGRALRGARSLDDRRLARRQLHPHVDAAILFLHIPLRLMLLAARIVTIEPERSCRRGPSVHAAARGDDALAAAQRAGLDVLRCEREHASDDVEPVVERTPGDEETLIDLGEHDVPIVS